MSKKYTMFACGDYGMMGDRSVLDSKDFDSLADGLNWAVSYPGVLGVSYIDDDIGVDIDLDHRYAVTFLTHGADAPVGSTATMTGRDLVAAISTKDANTSITFAPSRYTVRIA